MKNVNKIYYENHFIFLLIFFLNIHYSFSTIQTGKYPYSKKLNNGNYIVLSSSNILFVDSTFSTVVDSKSFTDIGLSEEKVGSTTVSQFESDDNGYIIAILYKNIYIFTSNGMYLYDEELSYISGKASCSIIPNNRDGNHYYFTIIYTVDSSGNNCDGTCKAIQFKKAYYDDSSSKSIDYIEENFYTFNITENTISGYFTCSMMKKGGEKYIGCFYGIHNKFYCTIFNFTTYEIIKTSEKGELQIDIIKALVKPDEMEKGLVCGYKSGGTLVCLNYNISSYSFGDYQYVFNKTDNKQCGFSGGSLIIEYFSEDKLFIVGCVGNSAEYHLSQFSSDLNFVKMIETTSNPTHGNLVRISIVLPSGSTQYHILACSDSNSGPIKIELNLDTISESETESQTEFVTESQTEFVTESQTEFVTESQTEFVSESQTEFVSESQTEFVTESQTEFVSESQTESITESQTESVSESQTESIKESQTESITESQTESVSESQTEEIIQNEDKCELKEMELFEDEISIKDINDFTVDYVNKYGYSNKFVSKIENEFYSIYSYKNLTCLQMTSNEASQIDFGKCYEKVKNETGILEDLIITIINPKEDIISNTLNKFYFSNPTNGELINISEICSNETIEINEDIKSLIDQQLDEQKKDFVYSLTKQGINVFDLSHEFFNDMCYYYESPNGKDVPIKDRISAFYQNITLCNEGCQNKGIDLENLKAKCECIFNDIKNNNLMNNLYGQAVAEVMDVISSLNIDVVKCFKELFNKQRFKKCTGGFFILVLLVGKLGFCIRYIFDGLYNIRKYVFSLIDLFNKFMKKSPAINFPPKKKKNKSLILKSANKKNDNNSFHNSQNYMMKRQSKRTRIFAKKHLSAFNSEKFNFNEKEDSLKSKNNLKQINPKLSNFPRVNEKGKNNEDENERFNKIKDLLNSSFDDEDFDDVLNSEQRQFWDYFKEKFKNNQIFVNSFCIHEVLKPRSLKILNLIMTIELYFVINALFYNEEYLSELFNSNKKDSFFSFVPRRFNQLVYIYVISGIISYLIGFFFVEEEKIKRIFRRNIEDNLFLLKELSDFVEDIKNRFIGLIFLSIFLSIICFVYISCFNIVYPYIREEWIKSSIFILVLMQIINLLLTFFHCSFRYLSIYWNSEKIFRLSVWLA